MTLPTAPDLARGRGTTCIHRHRSDVEARSIAHPANVLMEFSVTGRFAWRVAKPNWEEPPPIGPVTDHISRQLLLEPIPVRAIGHLLDLEQHPKAGCLCEYEVNGASAQVDLPVKPNARSVTVAFDDPFE
jgi:hypothetical protein